MLAGLSAAAFPALFGGRDPRPWDPLDPLWEEVQGGGARPEHSGAVSG